MGDYNHVIITDLNIPHSHFTVFSDVAGSLAMERMLVSHWKHTQKHMLSMVREQSAPTVELPYMLYNNTLSSTFRSEMYTLWLH